jgi:aspartate-semialdehyde dehydrogenase
MSLHHPTVAIVGATGAVGSELMTCLESRDFPLERLRLFASGRSAGRKLLFRGRASRWRS